MKKSKSKINTLKVAKQLVKHFGSQINTGNKLGVKQPTVWGWLNGKGGISPKNAIVAEEVTHGKFKAIKLSQVYVDVINHHNRGSK